VIYLRCIRFNTNQEKISVRDSIKNWSKTWVCWNLVHRTVVQLQTSHSRDFISALRYNSPDCPVFHQTVRWASGATTPCVPMVVSSDEQCHGRSQRSPDCPVQQKDKRLQWSTAPNPNGRADVARTRQWTVTGWWRTGLFGAPIASSLCQWLGSGWGL
jgi:hypothetical protein